MTRLRFHPRELTHTDANDVHDGDDDVVIVNGDVDDDNVAEFTHTTTIVTLRGSVEPWNKIGRKSRIEKEWSEQVSAYSPFIFGHNCNKVHRASSV